MSYSIGIVGAGAWGSALANVQKAAGRSVVVHSRQHPAFEALGACSIVLLVVSAQALRGVLESLKPHLNPKATLVLCCKGLELPQGSLLSTTVTDVLGEQARVAVLSGPNFASEIARGMPAAATLACRENASELADALGTRLFRLYASDDVVGAQIGGAMKNVIAIASGMVVGAGLGENARAALITRGLAETMRLAKTMGGRTETLMGMSGLGDLVLTATSPTSRNYALGYKIGQGGVVNEKFFASLPSLTEGVPTAHAAYALAQKQGLDLPITEAVHHVLEGRVSFDAALQNILNRPMRVEAV